MVDRAVDAGRLVLPVRQQVHADQVHVRGHLGELLPEFPNLAVGDGLAHGRADLVDIRNKFADGQVTAQQHLVADDQRG